MIEKIAAEWELRGYTCDEWLDPPGQQWENYVHEVDELFMVLEGNIQLEIAGKICNPAINEVVHIPAHTQHSVRNKGNTIARWLYGYKTENVNESDIANYNS